MCIWTAIVLDPPAVSRLAEAPSVLNPVFHAPFLVLYPVRFAFVGFPFVERILYYAGIDPPLMCSMLNLCSSSRDQLPHQCVRGSGSFRKACSWKYVWIGIRYCVEVCAKVSDRKCVLSLLGDAVSASYVPFQSDHKVMAHSGINT
jgi:hypothetical protein